LAVVGRVRYHPPGWARPVQTSLLTSAIYCRRYRGKAVWKQLKDQRGFTLIELVVVIAILGVLAAVAVPMITNYLDGAKERSYKAELDRIQSAVDAFYGAPDNARFIGKRQYPLIGRNGSATCATSSPSCTTATTTAEITDDGNPFNGTGELWNPVGGTQGVDLSGAAAWTDGGADGIRVTGTTTDTWARVSVTRNNVTYFTDPRYFFIDFEALVTKNLLTKVPDSASPDNAPTGSTATYTGNYIWYVNHKGTVQSMYRHFPDNKGYQAGVFP
jgi:prepilin-type N-terminal cleavage/methylation domain-containing protein